MIKILVPDDIVIHLDTWLSHLVDDEKMKQLLEKGSPWGISLGCQFGWRSRRDVLSCAAANGPVGRPRVRANFSEEMSSDGINKR